MIVTVSISIRRDLATRARRKGTRTNEWTDNRPTDWRPYTVRDPSTGGYFTDVSAWDYIADLVEGGHPINIIALQKPLGKSAYVMHVELEAGKPSLYIKLELGRSVVHGRSFHYSEIERGTDGQRKQN